MSETLPIFQAVLRLSLPLLQENIEVVTRAPGEDDESFLVLQEEVGHYHTALPCLRCLGRCFLSSIGLQ